MEYRIEAAGAEDMREIAELDRAMWGDFANPVTLYRQLIDIFPETVLVARDESGRLAGFTVTFENLARQRGWVLSIDLHEDFRGKGLGKLLIRQVLQSMRERDLRLVTAIIAENNIPSQKLFSSFGFHCSAIEKDYFSTGKDQQRWELELG